MTGVEGDRNMVRQEQELDAAEYVIGTMSAVERRAFEDLLAQHPQARADVAFWERAFGALNASVSPEPVPDVLWTRIEQALPHAGLTAAEVSNDAGEAAARSAATASAAAALAARQVSAGRQGDAADGPPPAALATGPASLAHAPAAVNDNRVGQLTRSRRRWRWWAVAATLLAGVLGWVLGNQSFDLDPRSPQFMASRVPAEGVDGTSRYVAVVQSDPTSPALIVNVDAASGEVTVRTLGIEKPADKSLEVWFVKDGEAPVSVGLLGEGKIDLKDRTAGAGDIFAISVEPPGGAPGDSATGPVVYSGRLVPAPE